MSFDLKSLELFVRVAALGAIGRAGTEFNLSSTNATYRIKALEIDLQVKLLNRTTRAVSLTPDGEIFLDYAKRILNDVEDARTVLSQTTKTASGVVRVTASASLGRTHIVPFVPEFSRLYPDVKLDLNLTDNLVDIVEQGYDLAFRMGELAPSTLLAQKLDDNPVLLVASPEYLARKGSPEHPEDLRHHDCLTLGERHGWHLRGPDGAEHRIRCDFAARSNLGDALVEWAAGGMGIAHAALWHAGAAIEAGRLVPVLPGYSVFFDMKMWAVRPPGRLMPLRVKVFLDFMQARIIATNQKQYGSVLPLLSQYLGK